MKVSTVQFRTYSNNLLNVKSNTNNTNLSPVQDYSTSNLPMAKMSTVSFYGLAPKIVSSFEKEIAEQPKVLKKLVDKYFLKPDTVSNMELGLTKKDMQGIKRIRIIASGSSKNSADMARDFIEQSTNIPVSIESAGEFINKKPVLSAKEDLVVYVSQSGNTADTLSALMMTKDAKVKSIAITNNPESKIFANADANLLLETGVEKAVAATKTVTSSIFNLMAMGLKLGEIKGSVAAETLKDSIRSLSAIPKLVEEEIASSGVVRKAAKVIKNSKNVYFYAKGANIGAAKEGALKLTETTGKRVIADSSSEALHGMFASIEPKDPVLQIVYGDTAGMSYRLGRENIEEISKKRNIENLIIMKHKNDKEIEQLFPKALFIDVPNAEEIYTPILSTVRFQQLTNEVTKLKGVNPDNGGGFLTKYRGQLSLDAK